jgi:hypothetical protein
MARSASRSANPDSHEEGLLRASLLSLSLRSSATSRIVNISSAMRPPESRPVKHIEDQRKFEKIVVVTVLSEIMVRTKPLQYHIGKSALKADF